MTMIRFNSDWDFQNMGKMMNRFIHENFTNENRPRFEVGDFKPRIDVLEAEKALYFEAEIPGVKKEDVKVSVNDENILIIKGEKKFDRKEEATTCCRNERNFGEFVRSFQLPENIDNGKISASYDNGVLTLMVPKIEPAKPVEKEVVIS